MRIKSISARGFIGIQKGLGLDEISLNMSHLNGLVALSGANGGGKTSFLELLHPYRTLASRSRALQHHVYLRDAYKDLTFGLNGDTYRTLVKIDSQSGKQEGFVWRNDAPQVDGKARSYDEYIEDLLGSPDLFFASVFAAQGSKKLNEMTTGELKSLMTEFLKLDELVRHEQTSKAIANALSQELDHARRNLETLTVDLNEKRLAAEQLETALQELEALKWKRDYAAKQISEAEEERAALKLKAAAAETARAQVEKLTRDLQGVESEKTALLSDYARADLELSSKLAITKERIEATRKVAAKKASINETQETRTAAQKGLKEKEAALSEVSRQLEAAREEYQKAANAARDAEAADKAEIDAIMSGARVIQEYLASAENEIKTLKAQLEKYHNPNLEALKSKLEYTERQAADLEKRDPACTSKICSFIKSAIEAQEALPGLRKEVEQAQAAAEAEKAEIKKKTVEVGAQISALKEDHAAKSKAVFDAQAKAAEAKKARGEALNALEKQGRTLVGKRDELQKAISDLKEKIAEYDRALEYKDEIAAAEKEAAMIEERLIELKAQTEKLKADHQARLNHINTRIKSLTAEVEAQKTAVSESEKAAEGLAALGHKIAQATELRSSAEGEIEKHSRKVAVIEAEAKKVPTIEAEVQKAQAALEQINTEISEWTYLKNACGANGLRALEIDSVAPLVTGISNDLLLSTFGPGHTLRFRTQDDEGRECLDILAIREDGEEVLLDNLSGGQKVWSLKALRLALTLLAKEKSGKLFYTAFADEEDGALDTTRAQDFIRLYRAFMNAGGIETCLYISHKPECVAMADHVLEFRKGGIEVG